MAWGRNQESDKAKSSASRADGAKRKAASKAVTEDNAARAETEKKAAQDQVDRRAAEAAARNASPTPHKKP